MQQTAGHRYQNTLDCNERRIVCEKNYIAQALSHKTIEFLSEGSSFDTEEVAMDSLTFKSQNNNIPRTYPTDCARFETCQEDETQRSANSPEFAKDRTPEEAFAL